MYVCKTIRLMNYLCKKFDVIKVQRDNKNSNYIIFLFEDTEELREYLSKYKNNLQ